MLIGQQLRPPELFAMIELMRLLTVARARQRRPGRHRRRPMPPSAAKAVRRKRPRRLQPT
jgi:hypothetical protein